MFRRSFSTTAAKAFKIESVKPVTESPYSSIKVIIDNAGSASTKPGLAHLVKNFSFLNTTDKSGLRLKRESELIGGTYQAKLNRDSIELTTTFPKEALPFYVNALSSLMNEKSFKQHELDELVKPYALLESAIESNETLPLDQLHYLTFRSGLGNPLYYNKDIKSSTLEEIVSKSSEVFTKANIKFQLSNVDSKDFESFLNESSFASLAEGAEAKATKTKTFNGLESRVRATGTTKAVVGIPVTDIASYNLLAAKLIDELSSAHNANPSLKFESKVLSYGLFYVYIESTDAAQVASLLKTIAPSIKSSSNLKEYTKLAQLNLAENESTVDLSKAADSLKNAKFNFVVVGDVDAVPFADEL